MRKTTTFLLILACIAVGPSAARAESASEGTLSLATTPRVMVYVDGTRVGMSPLINRRLSAGEHRVSLLLILPSGNRLRADYRVIIEAGRDTVASLDLSSNPPREGEVRTIAPAPIAPPRPPPRPPAPAKAPAKAPPAATSRGGSWATSPGRPRTAPVAVAARPQKAPPPPRPAAPPPPPEPQRGLTREMVREGMEAMRPAVERCLQGAAGLVQVRLSIQPDGGVADVAVQGAYRGTGIGNCIEEALPEEAAFPIYPGDPIPVVYPYRVVH